MLLLVHVVTVCLSALYLQQTEVSAFVTLGFFSQCVDDETDCVSNNLAIGQYPVCSDCSMFVKCNGAASAIFTCQSGLNYDVTLGVCNHVGQAICGTRATSATSPTSLTSITSPTSPTSMTSITSPTGPPTLPVFSQCVNSVADCTSNNLAQGQYPVCTDCSMFVKCSGVFSADFTCPSGTEYDVSLGVCNHIGIAVCGTI